MERSNANTELQDATWTRSLAFWLLTIVAVALYASVALSPRLLNFLDLRSNYIANQMRLISLEHEVHYLQRVIQAFEREPEFTEELARIEFDIRSPDEDLIPVDPSLTLDAVYATESAGGLYSGEAPWYRDVVEMYATNVHLRAFSLGLATLLILIAFGFTHGNGPRIFAAGKKYVSQSSRNLARRYQTNA